jgi:O-antigen/teichoic acid export membrane protein
MKVGAEVSKRFVTNVLGTVAGFAGTIYFARVLGADGIGVFAIFQGIQMLLATLVGFGTYATLTKYVSSTDDEARYFTSALILVAVGGAVSVLVAVGARGIINETIGVNAALLLPAGVVSWSLFRVTGAFLEGKGRVALAGLLENGRYIVIVGAQTAFVVAGYGVFGLLWGLVLGQLATFFVAYFGFARVRPALPTADTFRTFVSFSRHTYVQSLAGQLFKQADYVVLGRLLGPSAAGIYRVSFTISEASMLFAAALSQVSFPEFSRLRSEAREERIRELFDRVFAYSGVFAIPLFAGALVVGNDLLRTVYQIDPGTVRLPLVGDVGLAGALIAILALANLCNGYRGTLDSYFLATDRPRVVVFGSLLLIGTYAVSVVPLTVEFGTLGLGLTTTVSFLAACFVLAYSLDYRPSPSSISDVGAQLFSAGVMWVVLRALVTALGGGSGAARLAFLVCAGAGVYFISLALLSENVRNDVFWIARDLYDGRS